MLEIGAFEAKNTFGALLDRVERGEVVLITRHGRAVARLVPNEGVIDRAQILAAMKRIRDRASAQKNSFDWKELKQDRDAGRP
jgi:prevent-host-death family protein